MGIDDRRLQALSSLVKTLSVSNDVEYHSLIISIDLGTTYSGVGYVFTTEPADVHVINEWPSSTRLKTKSQKVPTVLKYGTGGSGYSWGYQVGLRDDKKIEAFKLLLDASLPTPEYTQVAKVKKALRESVKEPNNAVDDFMAVLYQYSIAAIEEKHPKAYANVLAVKFVVSTPSGWPETVKEIILGAARKAGMNPVTHISEAEAAASFCMRSTEARNSKLKVGHTILVCDAGGATVDLTSYDIKSLEPLRVTEIVPPITRPGGSLNLDKNFENHIMQNVLEEEEFIRLKKAPEYLETLREFDHEIKPAFSGASTRQFTVKLRGTTLTDYAGGKLKSNTMTFDKKALEVIFLPIANTVANCIKEQINAVKVKKVSIRSGDMTSVEAVILTGGFGSNKYLREHLGKNFPSMKFIQPTDTATAVVRGAARSQAPAKRFSEAPEVFSFNALLNAKATKSYGIANCPIFDESIHKPEDKYWDTWEGVWRCKSINWLIKRGDNLRDAKKLTIPCYKQCGPNPDNDEFFIVATLQQSTAAAPPDSFKHHSIRTNKTIKIPLDGIDDNLFMKKSRTSDREAYWLLAYEVVLEVKDSRIAFWIDINGQQFGRVAID